MSKKYLLREQIRLYVKIKKTSQKIFYRKSNFGYDSVNCKTNMFIREDFLLDFFVNKKKFEIFYANRSEKNSKIILRSVELHV